MNKVQVIPVEVVENKILMIRSQKVILDFHLAKLYNVETKILNKAVARNIDRFPVDFMFRLTQKEWNSLRFHFGTSNSGRGGRRYLPFAFTEHGALMVASVLSSPAAVKISILVVRAFVRLREILAANKELAQKLKELELKTESHDKQITAIFDAINQLLAPPPVTKKKMGFSPEETDTRS
ncbi:MAG TPA: ORF6N domain-containing protein [Ignavibacteria bacterium]|nr:ORF6N domain-containing protein [Ignavibacteria bacterium]